MVREACQVSSQFTRQINLYSKCSRRAKEVVAIRGASHLIIKTHTVKPQVEVGLVVIQQQSRITILCNIRIRWHLMDLNRTRAQQQASHINSIQTLNSHGSIRRPWKTMQILCTQWQVHSQIKLATSLKAKLPTTVWACRCIKHNLTSLHHTFRL